MLQKLLVLSLFLVAGITTLAQDEYLDAKAEEDKKIYNGGEAYFVKEYPQNFKGKKPRNIIFLIGDGMGFAHINAAMIANGNNLYMRNFKHVGLSETQSANKFTTDSSAGGTALATGVRINNSAIGIDVNGNPVESILEAASNKGLVTGLVASSAITHATPGSFIAHQESRSMYEEIALDFFKTDIDVFIGGGYKHFTERKDGRNLVNELKQRGYRVERDMEVIKNVKEGKLAGLTADVHNEGMPGRGNMLPDATKTALNILGKSKKGFFIMIEGSQIDWGGHSQSTVQVVDETLDFDKAVGEALEFAAKDKRTLIVITADHETGGMTVLDGDFETGMVKAGYSTESHTPMMVPVLAWGPGAEEFTGFMKNTDVHDKMKKLLLGK